jgi:hypothetical protein
MTALANANAAEKITALARCSASRSDLFSESFEIVLAINQTVGIV